jgi:HAD superfamily hydrolase (TIGR01509 family)
MERHSLLLDEDRFYSLGGMPTNKIIAMLSGEQGVSVDVGLVSREKERAFFELLHRLEPIAAIVEIARTNRGQKKMAVASGGFRHVIERQLRQIGCLDWFDTLVTAEDTELHKPEPDVFLEAARRLGAPAAECCVYEDSDLGIEAARRAGMTWVDVREVHTPKRVTVTASKG